MVSSHSEIDDLKARLRELETELAEVRATNEELQQFAYAASHDLKAALRNLSSFSELLSKRYAGKLDSQADEFIGFIVAAARRMEKLVTDLLAYARLLNEPARPAEEVSMQAVAEWAVMNLDRAIKSAGARVDCGPLPAVRADQGRILEVVQQLFSNALQYRSERNPEIRMTAEEREDGWLFAIADNGAGFDEKYAGQIFGPFKRLQNDGSDRSGMGLAFCRKIVERHGGRIWAESRPGAGSTFYFTLPA